MAAPMVGLPAMIFMVALRTASSTLGARRPVEVVLQCPGRRAHECSSGQRHEQQGLMTR